MRRRIALGFATTAVFVGLVYLAFMLYAAASLSGLREEVTLEVERIRADGLPATVMELNAWHNSVPDAENGALAYVLALEALENYPPTEATERVLPFWDVDALSPDAFTEEARAATKGYVDQNATALDLLKTAASLYDTYRFPIDLTYGMSSELPHLSKMRHATQLLGLSGLLHLNEADAAAWADSFKGAVNTALALSDEPGIVGQLVSVACFAIAAEQLQVALSHGLDLASYRQEISDLLRSFQPIRNFRTAVSAERVLVTSETAKLAKKAKPAILEFLTLQDLLNQFDYFHLLAEMFTQDEEEFLLNWRHARHQFGVPPIYKIYSRILLPSYGRAVDAMIRGVATRRFCLIALAVDAYERENGKLPTSLDLLPELEPSEIVDPFDGQRIRYVPSESGYILYTVHVDRVDNGGAEFSKETLEGDISFSISFQAGR